MAKTFTEDDDALLDELGVEAEAKPAAAARRVKNASLPALKIFNVSSNNTAAHRSTAKTATSSSGYMQFA